MTKRFLRTIVSCTIVVALLLTNFIFVTAEGNINSNTIGIKHYFNEEPLENNGIVFVGENFKTYVYGADMSEFTSWGLDLHFDNSKVKLVSFADNEAAVDSIIADEAALLDGVYGVKADDFLYTWAGGASVLTVADEMPYISNDEGYIWLYGFVPSVAYSAGLDTETTILALNFNAEAAGNPDIRFSASTDEKFDGGLEEGALFSYGEAGASQDLSLTRVVNSVIIKERPDDFNVSWNGNNATWDSVVSRGFVLNLYNDGDWVTTTELLDADVTEYPFSGFFNTPGDYTFTVTAKGGADTTINSEDFGVAGIKEVTIQLDQPDAPTWDTETTGQLNWEAVDNASEYLVEIYKKNDQTGEFEPVPNGSVTVTDATSVNVKDLMTEVGEYKATVTVTAGTKDGYTPSEKSEMSESFYSGTKIDGYVTLAQLLEFDYLTSKRDAYSGGITVELYSLEKDSGGAVINRTLYKEATSYANGSFGFKAISAGDYDVVVSATGYVPRIIPDVSISGKNFILSTFDTPIFVWPGDLTDSQHKGPSQKYPYGEVYINPNDITAMTDLIGNVQGDDEAFSSVADFDFDGINQGTDLNIVAKYSGKNSKTGESTSYPAWVIPQQ